MTEHVCQIVSKEELVAYADGDLPRGEAERIAEHIATCPDCQVTAEALERSLQITQAIWQTSRAEWPETYSLDRATPNRRFTRPAAIAASILLIVGVGTVWRLLSGPDERTHLINEEAKIAELRLRITDSADAARLFAAAELLSKYPGAENGLKPRYQHIVDTYPETAAASKARLRAQELK